jgi:hypothetical protein
MTLSEHPLYSFSVHAESFERKYLSVGTTYTVCLYDSVKLTLPFTKASHDSFYC